MEANSAKQRLDDRGKPRNTKWIKIGKTTETDTGKIKKTKTIITTQRLKKEKKSNNNLKFDW